jgi:hypothetical protein
MERDFSKLLMENQEGPYPLRVLQIYLATMSYLTLRLGFQIARPPNSDLPRQVIIRCTNAVEYSIRPANPATLEGGPKIEYYETHKFLENGGLQMVPGGDGEIFNPPLKLSLLILDQSYVIAERFVMEESKPPSVVKFVR